MYMRLIVDVNHTYAEDAILRLLERVSAPAVLRNIMKDPFALMDSKFLGYRGQDLCLENSLQLSLGCRYASALE
jgi:hypothetical protein